MNNLKLIEELSKNLHKNIEGLEINAAVVILLKICSGDLQVLLVKRAVTPTDVWSGQIAFPGGKFDKEDLDSKATIVRETIEETGIDLRVGCRFLGTIDPMRSIEKPQMKILPFVFLKEKKQIIKLNEELTEYFWISVKRLEINENTVKLSRGEFPAFVIDTKIIWGLTYNILKKLLTLLSEIIDD